MEIDGSTLVVQKNATLGDGLKKQIATLSDGLKKSDVIFFQRVLIKVVGHFVRIIVSGPPMGWSGGGEDPQVRNDKAARQSHRTAEEKVGVVMGSACKKTKYSP